MNRINEIGDTPRGQKALGAVFARAHNRKNWCDKNMVEPHRKDAKDYWQNVEHNASSEVGRNAKDKLKGFENFGDGAQEYYKNHLPNDTIQIPQHESKNGNMNKKLIKLTESDLHKIVKESVNKLLNEGLAGSKIAYSEDGTQQWWKIESNRERGNLMIRLIEEKSNITSPWIVINGDCTLDFL